MIRSILSMVLASVLASTSVMAECTPIRFARGQSLAVVQGLAPSDEPFLCYTLTTGRGQVARLKLTRSNGDTAFNIAGLIDNRDDHTFTTEAKQYRIDLYQMKSGVPPARFTMEVTVR